MVQHLGRIVEAAPSIPHWHLPWIGADSARQGLGLGSLLLRAGLSRVDQDGVECWLFNMKPRNVPLYQRHGFEIAVEGDVPDGGPHFRFMRRGPHPIARRSTFGRRLARHQGATTPRETPSSTLTQPGQTHDRWISSSAHACSP